MRNEEKINNAIEFYKENNFSINYVAKMFEIPNQTLQSRLKLLGIEEKEYVKLKRIDSVLKEVTPDNIDQIQKDYGVCKFILEKAMTMSPSLLKKLLILLAVEEYINTNKFNRTVGKIATKYGINKKTLTKYLKDAGIEVTKVSDFFVNEHAFDIIDTEEKAYWLGFMYADGWISKGDNSIGLSLSLKDKDHLAKFNSFLLYEGGMNVTTSHQFGSKSIYNSKGEILYMISTVISNKTLWNALNDKGCVPNKSLILKFPDKSIFKDESLIYPFIRGYFDGDGTLGKYLHSETNKTKEESLIFVGTLPFLLGILEYLGEGFIMQKKNCNEATFRLSYSTKKAVKAATLMYENSTIYLERKYNIFINDFAAVKSSKNGELCDENTVLN